VTPAGTLKAGTYRWWIWTWNTDGFGPWTAAPNFELPVPDPVGEVGQVAPTGTIATIVPAYRWNVADNATWYHLWVNNAANRPLVKQWYRSADICSEGTCQVTPTVTLADGSYKWWVRTWNEADKNGPWSAVAAFDVTTGD
jgi:hypothetical protein